MAVFTVEASFCSKPCRNNAGSASDTDALIPLPEAIGFSSGIVGPAVILPDALLAEERLTLSAREGRDIVPGTGPPTNGRAPDRGVSVNTISCPSSPKEQVDGRASGSNDRVDDADDGAEDVDEWDVEMTERRNRLAFSLVPASFPNIRDRLDRRRGCLVQS